MTCVVTSSAAAVWVQLVFLQRFRPDLPYVLVTAEFPRALGGMATESIEDRVFHLNAKWVAAWAVSQELRDAGGALPTLEDLLQAATDRVPPGALPGLTELVSDLKTAARYL